MDKYTPWVGVDLDGTLADTRQPPLMRYLIPPPVPEMVGMVKVWLAIGIDVRVFTARMCENPEVWQRRIGDWTEHFLGTRLKATNSKDYGCIAIYDDIAHGIIQNTGLLRCSSSHPNNVPPWLS